jgi:hypothetical protein
MPRAVGRRVAGKSVPVDDSYGVSQTHGQGSVAREVVIHLASDVAFEKADDVSLGASLLHLAFKVGRGFGVVGDPHHDDAPQGAIGLSIASTVEAVASDFAR